MTLWLYPQSRAKGKLSVLRDISLALRYLHQQEKTLVPADGLGSGGICRNAIGFFYDFFPFHGQFLGDLDHGQVFFGGSPLAAKVLMTIHSFQSNSVLSHTHLRKAVDALAHDDS